MFKSGFQMLVYHDEHCEEENISKGICTTFRRAKFIIKCDVLRTPSVHMELTNYCHPRYTTHPMGEGGMAPTSFWVRHVTEGVMWQVNPNFTCSNEKSHVPTYAHVFIQSLQNAFSKYLTHWGRVTHICVSKHWFSLVFEEQSSS